VAFEGKVLNLYGTYDRIAKNLVDDPGYTYLYCKLLDATCLTTITLKVKFLHSHVHEQLLQKRFYVKIKKIGVEGKSQRGFEKGGMFVLIMVESTTIV
jgi:hypothetical protein